MGLPVRQRKALDRIEHALCGSDPRLAALYAMFGRLVRNEDIPVIEQLRHGARVWLASLRLALAAVGSRLMFWQRHPSRGRQPVRHPLPHRHPQGLRHQQPQRLRHRQAQRLSSQQARGPRTQQARRPPRSQQATRSRRGPGFRLSPRQRVILFYPIAIALAVTSLVLAAKFSPGRACLPVRAVAAAKNVAKSNLCRPPANLSPLSYGR
jgi:hypothetical protein